MATEAIVTIRNLSKIYQQGEINVTALDDISLAIAAREFLALIGPSGSGKFTLPHNFVVEGRLAVAVGNWRTQEDLELKPLTLN